MNANSFPDNVQAFLKRGDRMLIGGEWAGAQATIEVIDPAHGRSIAKISDATAADVDAQALSRMLGSK